jgi:ribosomal protein L20A (L18A)
LLRETPSLPRTTVSTSDTEPEPGQVNAFKEFRAPSLQAALSELYTEMGAKQKVTKESISIIKVVQMKWDDMIVRNQRALRFRSAENLKLGHWRKRFRAESKQYRSHFRAARPAIFKTDVNVKQERKPVAPKTKTAAPAKKAK